MELQDRYFITGGNKMRVLYPVPRMVEPRMKFDLHRLGREGVGSYVIEEYKSKDR